MYVDTVINFAKLPHTTYTHTTYILRTECRGVSWGGLWGLGPPGSPKGRQKERKKEKGKKERGEKRGKKEEKKGIRKKKGRKREQERKKKERKLNQYDERGAMQSQVQAGAPGKKTSGAPN